MELPVMATTSLARSASGLTKSVRPASDRERAIFNDSYETIFWVRPSSILLARRYLLRERPLGIIGCAAWR